jgi:hypothetical protein
MRHWRTLAMVWCMVASMCLLSCGNRPAQRVNTPWQDDFERDVLGDDYDHRGGTYRLLPSPLDGRALSTLGDHNLPLWSTRALPRNVRVEFDALADSNAVDIKLEVFGDGVRHESGYIVVLGGWSNSISIIARRDEHQRGRAERKQPLTSKQRHHVVVERTDGATLVVRVDGVEWMKYQDTDPLFGAGHDRFAFSSWESDVWFDNVVVTPLP